MTEPRFGLPDPANPLARELEQVAHQLPDIARPYDQLRALLHNLPAGRAPVIHSARAGTPVAKDPTAIGVGGTNSALTGPPPGFDSGAQIGILPQLFYGQSNVVADPDLADLIAQSAIGTVESALGSWGAKHVVNVGSVAGTRSVSINYVHGDTADNPFNSHDGEYHITGIAAGASNVDYYLRSQLWSPVNIPGQTGGLLVVGAMRVTNIIGQTLTNITSCKVALQLINEFDAVIATGSPVEWTTMPYTGMRQLTVSSVHLAFGQYRLRLKISLIATGTGGNINVDFGEPQLSFSTTERPPPYTPLISAKWRPDRIVSTGADSNNIIIAARSKPAGDTFDSFQLIRNTSNWNLEFGPGSATTDTRLGRAGVGQLKLSGTGGSNNTTFDIEAKSGQTNNLRMYVAGDSVPRLLMAGDAGLVGFLMSTGGGTADVRLSRASAGRLEIDANGQANQAHLDIKATAGQQALLGLYVAGDTNYRVEIDGDATAGSRLLLGPGNATADSFVGRVAAGALAITANGQAVATHLLIGSTAGQVAQITMQVSGDTVDRVEIRGDATETGIEFGPGNASRDARVTRPNGGQLVFDANGQAFTTVLDIVSTSGQTNTFRMYVAGDTNERIRLTSVGGGNAALVFGPGNAAQDVFIGRVGAKALNIDDNAGGILTTVNFRAQINFTGEIGFFGTGHQAKKTVTGSRGGNAALASLLTQLAGYGLLTDSSTA